ncbi:MAG: hypothetical protein ACRC20_00755 [Segniliparus sp.]|uniref:hypothetical protein n=1 Tax=Segniliparus sp. TaxID=2804064 RepID=UPI003F35806F
MEYTYDPPEGVPSFSDTRPTRAPFPPLTSRTMSAVVGAGGAADVLVGAGGGGGGGVVSGAGGGGGGGAGSGSRVRVTVVVWGGAGAGGGAAAGGGSEGSGGGSEEDSEKTGGMREVLDRAAGASCFDGQARYATRPPTAARESTVPAISPFDGPPGPGLLGLGPAGSCGVAGVGASSRRYG